MNKLTALIVCLLALVAREARADFILTGTAQYNRLWTFGNMQYTETGTQFPMAQRTGVRPLVDVHICLRRVSDGLEVCPNPNGGAPSGTIQWTNASGQFNSGFPSASFPSGQQVQLFAQLAGLSINSLPTNGYRVTASQSSTTPLEVNLGAAFAAPASGTSARGALTVAAGLEQENANAHQVMQVMVSELRNTWLNMTAFYASAFKLAVDNSNLFDGPLSTGSCEFQLSGGNGIAPELCWHEYTHELYEETIINLGRGIPADYGQVQCTQAEAGGTMVNEAVANLVPMLIGFTSVNNLAQLPSLAGYCSPGSIPNDAINNCSACEFPPSLTTYPVANSCGTNVDNNIQETECRALKMLIDIIDSVPSGGAGCLTENVQYSVNQLFGTLFDFPDTTGEGGVRETNSTDAIGTGFNSGHAFGMMDVLRRLPNGSTVTANMRYPIWANACYLPGDSNWGNISGTFLPAGGADPAPF